MQLKDATRSFGSVGSLLALVLILIAADAIQAQRNRTIVVYRTRTINTRPISYMAPTVIMYRSPASYRSYGDDSMYYTRGVRYVSPRSSYYDDRTPGYVVARNGGSYYPVSRRSYIAVRNVDYDDAPRYAAVRRYPGDADTGTRYVVVRNYQPRARYVAVVNNYVPRTRYVAVRNIDYDDDYDVAPSYIAVRSHPVYDSGPRYVRVRDTDDYDEAPTRYVAVRNVDNGCACAVSSLDQVETVAPRHVVVKTDYIAGTQEIITPSPSYDDTAYVAQPLDTAGSPGYVTYSDAAYTSSDDDGYIPASDVEYPRTVNTRTVGYVPVSDNYDTDDQAILDDGGTTYVAADDVENAYLSPVAYRASPAVVSARAVSYVPAEDVDDVAFQEGDTTYISADNAASMASYVPVADELNNSCSCGDALGAEAISYQPVTFVPVDDMNVEAVSYVPADSVDYVDTNGTAADSCSCE